MAQITDKSKEMLKRFLTFNFESDYDKPEVKEKFADMFRKMLMTDDPGMKEVVNAMFTSFNNYNIDNKVIGNDEGSSDEQPPPEEPVADELPAEDPTAEPEQTPEEVPEEPVTDDVPVDDSNEEKSDVGGIFGESKLFPSNILESINYWLED